MAEMESTAAETKAPDARCRVCLEVHSETMSLYEEIKIEGFQKETLSKILFDCGNVRVHEFDNKPQMICVFCSDKAKEAYKFQLTCQQSNCILQDEYTENLFKSNNLTRNRKTELINDTNDLTALEIKCEIKILSEEEEDTVADINETNDLSVLESGSGIEFPEEETEVVPEASRTISPEVNKCVCGKSFPNLKNFLSHEKRHKCQFCGYFSLIPTDLSQHKLEKHPEEYNKHKCALCKKGFTTKQNLNIHMRLHTGEKPFVCDVCGLRFPTDMNLNTHKFLHTGKKPYTCYKCGKSFAIKQVLEAHLGSHTHVRSFACDLCEATFKVRHQLTKHKYRHRDNKRHKCSECNKSFHTLYELRFHNLKHTGIKNFKCEVCEKEFNRAWTLKIHMKIHTGEKPYVCHVCGTAFSHAVSLRTHLKSRHENDS